MSNFKPVDYDTACDIVNKLLDENIALKKENAMLHTELKKVCLRTIDFNIYNSKLKELLALARAWLPKEYIDEDFEEAKKQIDQVLADNQIQANTVACNKIQENNNG